MADGAGIVAIARDWIGTPYIHQASVQGAGADCLGLIRGVWRALYGQEPEAAPAYTPDWGEFGTSELLLAGATRHLLPVTRGSALAEGQVLLFRMRGARSRNIWGSLPRRATPRASSMPIRIMA